MPKFSTIATRSDGVIVQVAFINFVLQTISYFDKGRPVDVPFSDIKELRTMNGIQDTQYLGGVDYNLK